MENNNNNPMLSYQRFLNYHNLSILWIQKENDNKTTKLGYAINKIEKKITKILKPLFILNEERDIDINDINADNALTDSVTKKFVYDIIKDKEGNEVQKFAFTQVSRKKRDKEVRERVKKYEEELEKLLSTEVEFNEQYYATEIPDNITGEERDAFRGIVIKPEEEEK